MHAHTSGDDLAWEEADATDVSFVGSDNSALFGDIGGVMMLVDGG